VTKNGQVISTGVTNTYGTFSIQLNPQPVGTILKVHVKDSAGNTSEEVEVTVGQSPPVIEEVFKLTNQDRTIKGMTDPDSTVYVKKGSTVIGKGKSNQKGAFTIPIPLQKAGTELTIYAESSLNLVSEVQTITVTAIPGKPSVKAVGDNTVSVKGTAAPDVTIIVMAKGKIVGETESNSNGTFTVRMKAKQKAGTVLTIYVINSDENKSLEVKVTVQDQTPPPAPTVTSKITSSSTSITGKGEIGSSVYIYNGSKLLAKVNVDKNGVFNGKIAAQKKGVRLAIYAKDKVGNKSAVVSVVVR
ncbi:MAG TPA: Ig-like domain-containing protein, partial [Pseudoneobacillus sp.]|nr:Ig-like domain-containing protein [Pseudoneobacillus sp.]